MKRTLYLLVAAWLCLSASSVRAQLIQSSSLITTVEKLKPVKRGYQSHIQLAYAMTNPGSRSLDLGLSYIGGFRFNNTFFLGPGAEILYADYMGSPEFDRYMPRPEVSLPVFAHFRVYFLSKRVSPFFALSSGYSIGFPNSKEFEYNGGKKAKYTCGGLFGEPIIGVNARVSHKTSLYLSFSYRLFGFPRLENVKYNEGYSDSGYKSFDIKQKTVGALRMNIGVTF